MRVIIFGCGGVGIETMHKLMANGDEIVCFSDNSKSKWGVRCEDKRVVPPQEILQEQFDYIAIGVYKAANIIREQLHRMGIADEKIIVPIEPDRIFVNENKFSAGELVSLEQDEYTSLNTLAYERLDIKITDKSFLEKLESLKRVLAENNIPRGKICIVGGAVLQAFGVGKPKEFDDIDIIMTNDLRKLYGSGLVIVSDTAEMHIEDEYAIPDQEIISNREYHFVYDDLKFIHPSILYEYGKEKKGNEYELLKGFCNMGRSMFQNGCNNRAGET